MSGAQWMAVYILAAFAVFVVWDLWYWRKDKRTLSQWVIEQTERKFLYKILAWVFCLVLIGIGIWLIPHWQLL